MRLENIEANAMRAQRVNHRRRASGGRTDDASSDQMRRSLKLSKQVSIGPARGVLLLLVAVTILVTCCSQVFRGASARYVHPTYKFRSAGLDEDMDRLERQGSDIGGGPARRQDFDSSDGENDKDDDDDTDQNTAASYQNQDEDQGNNGRGGGGGATDGYDDTEPDGPYEETPVEQEGQADLERFFDDHLGASDRDGMDKENLPSNLVSLLSEPPLAAAAQSSFAPLSSEQQQEARATVNSITVVPMAPVENQQVRPRAYDSTDPFDMMSTVQETSFIRLPDEKMIVTHQVTARNRPLAPLKLLADNAQMSGDNSGDDDDDDQVRKPIILVPHGGRQRPLPTAGRGEKRPSVQRTAARGQQAERSDLLAARSSEIVATENEDDDRVYVTNATDRPFRIADLGGYDPEEDFIDAAQELEVMATARDRRRQQIRSRGPVRGQARIVGAARSQDDNQYAWAASSADRQHQEPNGEVMSFRVPETDQLYGDASETDEVTFGQDDPYQTDLEAEMRQQEYDKISGWRRQVPEPPKRTSKTTDTDLSDESQPDLTSGSSNVAVDNGQPASDGKTNDDIDDELDNEYQSEPKVEQTEARSMRARSRPMPAAPASKQRKDDFDDEGGWANDGVEEMDIPSQAHQNTVLEKAAKREEAARRAAAEGSDAPGDQSGQASDGESERMPNADYLKNDLKEDDSGYAKAA